MKFLVIWKLELSLLSSHVAGAVARMPAYARPLERSGQIVSRYHIVGAHGGAWVFQVGSNTELERLIALMPVYNFAHFTVYPLAEMPDWEEEPVSPGTHASAPEAADAPPPNRAGGTHELTAPRPPDLFRQPASAVTSAPVAPAAPAAPAGAHISPTRRVRANGATVRPARRLTVEAMVSV